MATHEHSGSTSGDASQNEPEQFNPLNYSFKLRNDASLTSGSLLDVVRRTRNLREYDPTLAHYLAYTCSLIGDDLTSPTFTVPQRLGWTDNVEFLEYEGQWNVSVLMMTLAREYIVLAFRGKQDWEHLRKDLSASSVPSDRLIPHRVAVAEQHRLDSKKHQGQDEMPPRYPRENEEKLFFQGPDRVTLHTGISGAYQSLAYEVRSYVAETVGRPMPILDSIRYALNERHAHDGLDRYDGQAPKIIITGHGLGGAVAQLCALDLCSLYTRNMCVAYTFGQPRVGNSDAARMYSRYGAHLFRVTNSTDPIVHLPTQISGFYHPKHTRVGYLYPPKEGAEGYEANRVPKRNTIAKPYFSIQASSRQTFRDSQMDMRVHSYYCGVSLPMRYKAGDFFTFVVRRLTDIVPPQPEMKKGDPPYLSEIDLSIEPPIYDLIVRDVEPSKRASMLRRLQVFTGSRLDYYSRQVTPHVEREVTEPEESDIEAAAQHAQAAPVVVGAPPAEPEVAPAQVTVDVPPGAQATVEVKEGGKEESEPLKDLPEMPLVPTEKTRKQPTVQRQAAGIGEAM